MIINSRIAIFECKCKDCDWSEYYRRRKFPYNIYEIFCMDKKPKKCPKCGGKLEKEKLYVNI